MAVNRLNCGEPIGRLISRQTGSLQNGRAVRRIYECIKTQLCTVAISLSLFNFIRLPREAFKYGDIEYLTVYSFWLVVVALPSCLLQLSVGQLSQQDAVGAWRAVPILRGVGHLKVLTSYLCCVYSMVYVALSAAYMIWIGKGSFPLKDCTKIQITPDGYENKMNASECFNTTFLAPFTEQPQYLGVMAVLVFLLWFFVPILLLYLHKSLKASLMIFTPIIVAMSITLSVFLSNGSFLSISLETADWTQLTRSHIWHSGLVQALLSTSVMSGYLISAGCTVYRQSDVRWTSIFIAITNLLAGWLCVMMWESIAGEANKDKSLLAILVLIYQSSVTEHRSKEWPLLAFGIIFLSGIITLLILLFPAYDKLQRLAGNQWRLFAGAMSALGTALTVAVLSKGISIAETIDELVVPILAIVTTTFEIIGFVFIYGSFFLTVDIKFITGTKIPWFWLVAWWLSPIILVGITGWWLRTIIRTAWSQGECLWPLMGALICILVILVIFAAIAVAKEEQYNLFTKISAAFRPSRLWGPEEPLARYIWMSQRFSNETLSADHEVTSESNNFSNLHEYPTKTDVKSHENWLKDDIYHSSKNDYSNEYDYSKEKTKFKDIGAIYSIPTVKSKQVEDQFRSPNVCIANERLDDSINCNCNRHFQLNVPDLRNNEISTSL